MPLSREQVLALDRRHVWHPYTTLDEDAPGGAPLVIERAEGARLWDLDGRSYLDGNSSWWVAGLGHRHPRLVRALVDQVGKLSHTSLAGVTHEPAAALARDLAAVAPVGLERVFFSDDGSTAIEAAIKLAVQFHAQTGRPEKHRLVALEGAFHGETLGAASLGGVELFRRAFGPLVVDVIHVPAPLRGDGAAEVESTYESAFAAVRETLERGAREIAALVIEPLVQGASGMRVYAPRYLAELRELCSRTGVLLVADEVFTGYGRTGTMWACDQAGIAPDILCLGKTFSGGLLPMAATLVGEHIVDGFRGGRERAFLHGHSFCGNPLGAAVAREVLAVMRDEDVLGQVARKAPRLRAAVEEVATLEGARRPRALGMVAAIDLDAGALRGDPTGYLGNAGWRVYREALARGAYLRPLGDTLYMAPPLTIPDGELDELCSIFAAAAAAVLRA